MVIGHWSTVNSHHSSLITHHSLLSPSQIAFQGGVSMIDSMRSPTVGDRAIAPRII
ncbi:hypothetical protein [Nostoc parmelioides]|uniref:Uncharacterized protein n=1 Tax=Nostoc parmelioides FACHB-3921 TaxID=2692909 RepID=A0ABR8BCN9_9NOSO|nr:hypothetical protein [Nostoc parmelioides]MBD2251852.1 hypothetical protein [Nostoc parmelioides FACHB-3921]